MVRKKKIRMESKKYVKMDPITHILKRPDMYVGSLDKRIQPGEWLFSGDGFIYDGSPAYSEGLWRIFLEPVSNVIDNVWRSRQAGIECKKIRVDISEDGVITIWNDGMFIPIEIHSDGVYNPQLIFGNLLTSSNYDDDEERLSSGRNGLGVKLTNVFSSFFTIECGDQESVYVQTWKDHMREVGAPVIKKKKNAGYTRLHFKIDLGLFGMERLGPIEMGLFHKTCVDMAMITRIPVLINEKKYHLKSFKDYVHLYPMTDKLMISWENNDIQKKKDERLEVIICPSNDDELHEIGFVNGIYNRDGGVHVDAVASEFFRGLLARLNKGRTAHLFTTKDVKNSFMIFVNAVLVNPTFSNQSKTRLNSPTPKVEVDPKFIATVCTKWGFSEKMKELLRLREMSSLRKTEKKARGYHRIEGLDHANRAGTKDSSACTLILCEGLSAKTYAVTGIDVGWNGRKGRDYFGIFALKGKLLNVRNATMDNISANKEIASIIQALNLRYKTDYSKDEEYETLSYGKVMIITDADVDGLHIASLILNLFHVLFPSLLRRPFLYWMMTPVAKIFQSGKTLTFYNDFEYQRALMEATGTRFKVKYYKGLGTSSDDEVKDTFGIKVVGFEADDETDAHLNMVFSKTMTNERKRWMEEYDPLVYETPSDTYSITEFLDQEHIRFSIDDCKRNIPNIYDGMKLSQRKILFSVLKKNLVAGGKSMKVAQLAGYVAETSNYHHGEQCLYDTITRMAQDFVGSNNIPLLAKDGQFGSRLYSGKDAANGRYIFTRMTTMTRLLFPSTDDELCSYTLDDGDRVEPDYYVPILPMILVNGCRTGIGSGWSCNVPMYDPLRLVECIHKWLENRDEFVMPALVPFYRGFTGRIDRIDEKRFRTSGILEEIVEKKKKKSADTHRITEIPIDISIDRYKEYMEKLLEEKKIKSFKNYSSPNRAIFHFTPTESMTPSIDNLNLTSDVSLTNMVLLNDVGKPQKYGTVDEIFQTYCEKRFGLYRRRKEKLLADMDALLKKERLRSKFLEDVIEGRIVVFRRSEDDIRRQIGECDQDVSFLLSIPLRQFTKEHLDQLKKKIQEIQKEYDELMRTTEGQLWKRELDLFEQSHKQYLTEIL